MELPDESPVKDDVLNVVPSVLGVMDNPTVASSRVRQWIARMKGPADDVDDADTPSPTSSPRRSARGRKRKASAIEVDEDDEDDAEAADIQRHEEDVQPKITGLLSLPPLPIVVGQYYRVSGLSLAAGVF